MLHRLWQSAMIGLARSDSARSLMQGWTGTDRLARQFTAGRSAQEALALALELRKHANIRASLFYLGEYLRSPELIAETLACKQEIIGLLGDAGLDVFVSVDPTQIGFGLDHDQARRNAAKLAEAIASAADDLPGVHCLMLDMEDASVVDATIDLHGILDAAELPAGLTLQAYLHRTEDDLRRIMRLGTPIRLVAGAFVGQRSYAYTRRSEVKASFRSLIDLIFSRQARDHGVYPIIATHDDRLHDYARERAATAGWCPGSYEFEMLRGVRASVAERLAAEGERVRLYLPFGRDWWPYAVRRIGEHPHNGWLLARSALARR